MQLQSEAQKSMLDEILDIDNEIIRFAGIIDTNERTLSSKTQKSKVSLLTEREEDAFAIDLQYMREIQSKFNNQLGKTVFFHVKREKLHQFIFFQENLIIYVTCEPLTEYYLTDVILKKIESTISNSLGLDVTTKISSSWNHR